MCKECLQYLPSIIAVFSAGAAIISAWSSSKNARRIEQERKEDEAYGYWLMDVWKLINSNSAENKYFVPSIAIDLRRAMRAFSRGDLVTLGDGRYRLPGSKEFQL